ncbi:MAG: phosphoribosylformylglycinamidine synthase, partial [Bacteroidales bacterium]|nr:phosphoribosylformylglycinamidine synthase [Bacteroidales bacterium]
MILFFEGRGNNYFAVDSATVLSQEDKDKLSWLFSGAKPLIQENIGGTFVGPRKEMITPWSTNAVEITQNMAIKGIVRIELFHAAGNEKPGHDPMLQAVYHGLDQHVFAIDRVPEEIKHIGDIREYNIKEGLALSEEEIIYLENLSASLNRKLTDSEVFGFSQVNSEHCRHKIFNGIFVIDGREMDSTLFQL